MNDSKLDDFLRKTKPIVKDRPYFMLETRHKMESVEGIRAEVERQKKRSRIAIVVTLAAGLAVGVAVTTLSFLFPADPESLGDGLIAAARAFIEKWKHYLVFPLAACVVALSLFFSMKRNMKPF